MTISLSSINQLTSLMVKCGVLFEVRTEFLNSLLFRHDRPTLSSERAPHKKTKKRNNHDESLKSGHGPQKGLDTKTDWLTDRQS
jgi:hypothetical protein